MFATLSHSFDTMINTWWLHYCAMFLEHFYLAITSPPESVNIPEGSSVLIITLRSTVLHCISNFNQHNFYTIKINGYFNHVWLHEFQY